MSKTIIIPDLHAPFHDERVWSCILNAARGIKAENCVIIGDFGDCYSISFYSKPPDRKNLLHHEIGSIKHERDRLLRIGFDEVIYCEGNHEFRLERYLCDRAPALYGLVSSKDLLLDGVKGVKPKWVPYRSHIRRGKVLYAHDIGYAGVYAGRHTLAAAGTNIVFGHSHRAGLVFDGTHLNERRFSLNVGWAGDINQVDYMHRARTKDWQHGFGFIQTDDRTGLVWPQFIPIVRGMCIVNGKVYRA